MLAAASTAVSPICTGRSSNVLTGQPRHATPPQVFCALPDMALVRYYDGSGKQRLKLSRLLPGEEPPEHGSPCSVLVMELCERGTLRQALRSGAFHQQAEGGGTVVDYLAVTEVGGGGGG
jgi:hypothetical protein